MEAEKPQVSPQLAMRRRAPRIADLVSQLNLTTKIPKSSSASDHRDSGYEEKGFWSTALHKRPKI